MHILLYVPVYASNTIVKHYYENWCPCGLLFTRIVVHVDYRPLPEPWKEACVIKEQAMLHKKKITSWSIIAHRKRGAYFCHKYQPKLEQKHIFRKNTYAYRSFHKTMRENYLVFQTWLKNAQQASSPETSRQKKEAQYRRKPNRGNPLSGSRDIDVHYRKAFKLTTHGADPGDRQATVKFRTRFRAKLMFLIGVFVCLFLFCLLAWLFLFLFCKFWQFPQFFSNQANFWAKVYSNRTGIDLFHNKQPKQRKLAHELQQQTAGCDGGGGGGGGGGHSLYEGYYIYSAISTPFFQVSGKFV